MQILNVYLRYIDRLLNVFFLLLGVMCNITRASRETREKTLSTEKSTQTNLCGRHHFFGLTFSFLCQFFFLLPPFCLTRCYDFHSQKWWVEAGAPCPPVLTALPQGFRHPSKFFVKIILLLSLGQVFSWLLWFLLEMQSGIILIYALSFYSSIKFFVLIFALICLSIAYLLVFLNLRKNNWKLCDIFW